MSSIFTLEEAFKLFEPGSGYSDCSRQVAENLELKLDSSFEDYVNLIFHNTYEWFDSFPCKYRSKSTLEKPKSAVKFLLCKEVVREKLGMNLCKEVVDKLDECWKKHWKGLVASRTGSAPVEHQVELAEAQDPKPTHTVPIAEQPMLETIMKENERLKDTIKELKEWLMMFVEDTTGNPMLCKMYKALLDKY